jgi:hypothetical protein
VSDGDRCQEDSLKDSARKIPTRKKIVRQQVSYKSMCNCVSPFKHVTVFDIGNLASWVTSYYVTGL